MRGETESLPPHRRFQGFQIESFQTLAVEQSLNIPKDLRRQQTVEFVLMGIRLTQVTATGSMP